MTLDQFNVKLGTAMSKYRKEAIAFLVSTCGVPDGQRYCHTCRDLHEFDAKCDKKVPLAVAR